MLTNLSNDSTSLRHWLYLVLCGVSVSRCGGSELLAGAWETGRKWVGGAAWICGHHGRPACGSANST